MKGITYDPADCAYCRSPLPVPRNKVRIYCDKACNTAAHQTPTVGVKGKRGRRPKHPENDRLVQTLITYSRNRPCMDCGGTFPSVCMDFDHRPGTVKRFSISQAKGKLLADVVAELDKCDLVCSNCHRIRTWITRRPT